MIGAILYGASRVHPNETFSVNLRDRTFVWANPDARARREGRLDEIAGIYLAADTSNRPTESPLYNVFADLGQGTDARPRVGWSPFPATASELCDAIAARLGVGRLPDR